MMYLSQIGYETLRQRLDEVSMQPHRMIGGPIDKELANDIIGENRTSLFDTHQMLNDWQRHRLTITRVKQTIDKEKEPGNTIYFFSNSRSGGKEHKSMNTSTPGKRRKSSFPGEKNSMTLP